MAAVVFPENSFDNRALVIPSRCSTAADVRKIAEAVRRRRLTSYGCRKLTPAPHDPARSPTVLAPVALVESLAKASEAASLVQAVQPPPVTIKEIQTLVSKRANVSITDMVSERRTHDVVPARHLAILLCRLLTTRSLPEIGRHFGGRDHTTVIYTVRKLGGLSEAIADAVEDAPLPYLVDIAFRQLALEPFSLKASA